MKPTIKMKKTAVFIEECDEQIEVLERGIAVTEKQMRVEEDTKTAVALIGGLGLLAWLPLEGSPWYVQIAVTAFAIWCFGKWNS